MQRGRWKVELPLRKQIRISVEGAGEMKGEEGDYSTVMGGLCLEEPIERLETTRDRVNDLC